jgi:hypothetical protein
MTVHHVPDANPFASIENFGCGHDYPILDPDWDDDGTEVIKLSRDGAIEEHPNAWGRHDGNNCKSDGMPRGLWPVAKPKTLRRGSGPVVELTFDEAVKRYRVVQPEQDRANMHLWHPACQYAVVRAAPFHLRG